MKKICLLLSLLIICSFCCGCFNSKKVENESNISSITSNNTENTEENEEIIEEIEDLVEDNTECFMEIYSVKPLDYEYEDIDGYHLVNDEDFKTFEDLKTFTESVYTIETAKKLYNKVDYENKPIYKDIDGRLYINVMGFGAKGYNVNWDDPIIEIKSLTKDTCEFTVTATLIEPGDNVSGEPYTKDGKAVLENGKWKLSEVIY